MVVKKVKSFGLVSLLLVCRWAGVTLPICQHLPMCGSLPTIAKTRDSIGGRFYVVVLCGRLRG